MDPATILSAINAAKVAIDAAVKVKDSFFNLKTSGRLDSAAAAKTGTTIDNLQAEIALHKKQFVEMAIEVERNRAIIQEQNEIIIGLSNALKVTAETVQRQRAIIFVVAAISIAAILVSLYCLTR